MPNRICSVSNCPYEHWARGYCSGHYQRVKKHGDPQAHIPLIRSRGEYDWERGVRKPDGDNGCWIWGNRRLGYATIRIRGVQMQAHRYVYERLVGPIPDGMVLDHLCHNADLDCPDDPTCMHRKCVNPAHLEATTQRTNVLRGHGICAANAKKTHCKRGHEYTSDNTRHVRAKDGSRGRVCLTCEQVGNREKHHRNRQRLLDSTSGT